MTYDRLDDGSLDDGSLGIAKFEDENNAPDKALLPQGRVLKPRYRHIECFTG
jgi:hypothetical protein